MAAKAQQHGYGTVKGARRVPQMKGDSLGRAKAKAPMGATPADHVVAPNMVPRQVTSKTMGKRLT
jgi:hypothetical protein